MIILASASPRRKELMGLLQVPFEVKTKEIEEVIDESLSPKDNVMSLARQKAEALACDYANDIVIGCDTVVVDNNQILGKPKDKALAYQMLRQLSGKSHEVYTGVCLIKGKEVKMFYGCTKVFMKALMDEEINGYIATGDPMDKAGAYGIQGYAAKFIEKIEGDYFNVVGLPVNLLYTELESLLNKNI